MKKALLVLMVIFSLNANAQVYLKNFEYPCVYSTEVCTFAKTDGLAGNIKYSKTVCANLRIVFKSEFSVAITDMHNSKYELKEVISVKTTDDYEMKTYSAIDNDNEYCTFSEIYKIKEEQLEYLIAYSDHTYLYTR